MQIDAKMGVGLAIVPAANPAAESRREPEGGFERELDAKIRPKDDPVNTDRKPEQNNKIEERKEIQPNADSKPKKPDLETSESPASRPSQDAAENSTEEAKPDSEENEVIAPPFLMVPVVASFELLPTQATSDVTSSETGSVDEAVSSIQTGLMSIADESAEKVLPEGFEAVDPEELNPQLAAQLRDKGDGSDPKDSKTGRTDNPTAMKAPEEKVLSDEIMDALNPVVVDPKKVHISKDLNLNHNNQVPGGRTPIHQTPDNTGLNSSRFQPKSDPRTKLFEQGKNLAENMLKGIGGVASDEKGSGNVTPELGGEEKQVGEIFGGDRGAAKIATATGSTAGAGTDAGSDAKTGADLESGLFEELVTKSDSSTDSTIGQNLVDTTKSVSTTRPEIAKEAVQDPKLQAHIVKQVSDRLDQVLASRRNGSIVVHLEPRELGQITVNIRQFGTRVDAEITTSNAQVRENLESGRQQLVQQVESKGLSLGSLNVNSQDAGMNGGKNPQENLQRQDFERMRNMSENFGDPAPVRIAPNIGIRPGSDWGMDLLI